MAIFLHCYKAFQNDDDDDDDNFIHTIYWFHFLKNLIEYFTNLFIENLNNE